MERYYAGLDVHSRESVFASSGTTEISQSRKMVDEATDVLRGALEKGPRKVSNLDEGTRGRV
jgi:hypothetical protein